MGFIIPLVAAGLKVQVFCRTVDLMGMASKLTVLSITPVLSIRGGIWAGLYLKNCPVSRHSYNSYHPCKFTGAWLKRRLAQAGIEAVVLKLSGTNSKQNKEMVMEMFRNR